MYQTSLGMNNMLEDLKKIQSEGKYKIFTDYRFIEPQYDYQTIQYAITLQNTEIVDFVLYDELQSIFVEVKKIEHVERLLTETARRFKTIPSNLPAESDAYKILWTENWDNFNRFVTLTYDRGQISGRIAQAATDAMPIINNRLGPSKTKNIERDILLENLTSLGNEEQAVKAGKQFFPDFSNEEMRELYKIAAEKNQP